MPFNIDFPETDPTIVRAKIIRLNLSTGPAFKVRTDNGAAQAISSRSLVVQPKTEAVKAIFNALPAFPFFVRG